MPSITAAEFHNLSKIKRDLIGTYLPSESPPDTVATAFRTAHRLLKEHPHQLNGEGTKAVQDAKELIEKNHGLTNTLEKFALANRVTKDFVQALRVRGILESVVKPENYYSISARSKALHLHDRFSGQNWGEQTTVLPDPSSSTTAPSGRARRNLSAATPAKAAKKPKKGDANFEVNLHKDDYPDDHPIFGSNGPFPACQTAYNSRTGMISIRTRPGAARKSSAFRGNNGFVVGDWFPNQFSTMAKGAHGSTQSGIFGTADDGVYSIISTKKYAGADKGSLEKFDYCAPGSIDNEDKTGLPRSAGLDAMRTSRRRGHRIRVFRGDGTCVGAPSSGIRYDGLYEIVKETSTNNKDGGVMVAFGMRRCSGQPAVDQSRPTAADRRLKKQVEDHMAAVKVRHEAGAVEPEN